MSEAVTIGIRFALYADLMLLFGLPLFTLYTPLGRALGVTSSRALGVLALAGLSLSALSIAAMTASMAGVGLAAVLLDDITAMVFETPMGRAWLVRIVALLLLVGIVVAHSGRLVPMLLAGLALGSLAWTGHGAAGEGRAGDLQLAGDIAHLLAAGAWLGALVGLSEMVFGQTELPSAHKALDGFAKAGTLIVATIVASGVLSGFFLVGWAGVAQLPSTLYGQLLLIKIALFVGMLVLAALNRFRLTPALAGGEGVTRSALRRSLVLETGAAFAILGLVAWLGTLEPPASAM